MPRENGTYSSSYVPDGKPEELHYAEINNLANLSTMALRFPEANSKDIAAAIYQPLGSGVVASTYQSHNSASQLSTASTESNSEEAAARSGNDTKF